MRAAATDEGTISEASYRRIRADIIFGRLAPGQRLKLDRMKQDYGIGVSTARELLNRLASEGLIRAEGMRGFAVSSVSAADMREIADMRQLLECHAIEASFAAGDMDWEGRVVAAYHKLAAMERRMLAGERSEAETWKRYDWEFHHALISACGSRALLDTHAAIYDKYLRYQIIAVVFRGELAVGEHQQLLQCALGRDVATARKILVTHIQDCLADTLARGVLA